MHLSQQAKKGITVLGGVIYSDYQGESRLFFHKGGKEDYVWHIGTEPETTEECHLLACSSWLDQLLFSYNPGPPAHG